MKSHQSPEENQERELSTVRHEEEEGNCDGHETAQDKQTTRYPATPRADGRVPSLAMGVGVTRHSSTPVDAGIALACSRATKALAHGCEQSVVTRRGW